MSFEHLGQPHVAIRAARPRTDELTSVPTTPQRRVPRNIFAAIVAIDIGIGSRQGAVQTAPARLEKALGGHPGVAPTHSGDPHSVDLDAVALALIPRQHADALAPLRQPASHEWRLPSMPPRWPLLPPTMAP